MPTIKLRGYITDVFPVQTFTNFAKKVFWLKEPDTERNPSHWELELHQNDVTQINRFEIGDVVEVECEVRGRQYTNKSHQKVVSVSLKVVGMELLHRVDMSKAKSLGRFTPTKSVPKDGEVKVDPQGKLL